MFIQSTQTTQAPKTLKNRPQSAPSQTDQPATKNDQVQIDWSGHKPAHRSVKKMTRGVAALTTAAGVGKAIFDVATTPSLTNGLLKAGLSLGITAAAVTAIDVGSGIAHHLGDNYLEKPNALKHTQWHTEPTNADYCMVGFSNNLMDKLEVFPKIERAIHGLTKKEPISWQVPEYKAYCLGEISADELKQKQIESGMLHS